MSEVDLFLLATAGSLTLFAFVVLFIANKQEGKQANAPLLKMA